MKYLCIVYQNEKTLEALSEAEAQAPTDEALDYDEVLRRSGHYIYSNALQLVSTATTARVKGGKVSVTDGPYAETHEQLGKTADARASYRRALSLARQEPVKRFLERRLSEISG